MPRPPFSIARRSTRASASTATSPWRPGPRRAPTVASRWLQRLSPSAAAISQQGFARTATIIGYGRACSTRALRSRWRPARSRAFAGTAAAQLFLQRGLPPSARPLCDLCSRILRLQPIDPFNRDPGAAERGTLYHISSTVSSAPVSIPRRRQRRGDGPADQRSLRRQALPAHIDIVWRPRFAAVGKAFLDWESARHALSGSP